MLNDNDGNKFTLQHCSKGNHNKPIAEKLNIPQYVF